MEHNKVQIKVELEQVLKRRIEIRKNALSEFLVNRKQTNEQV